MYRSPEVQWVSNLDIQEIQQSKIIRIDTTPHSYLVANEKGVFIKTGCVDRVLEAIEYAQSYGIPVLRDYRKHT